MVTVPRVIIIIGIFSVSCLNVFCGSLRKCIACSHWIKRKYVDKEWTVEPGADERKCVDKQWTLEPVVHEWTDPELRPPFEHPFFFSRVIHSMSSVSLGNMYYFLLSDKAKVCRQREDWTVGPVADERKNPAVR